MGFSTSAGRSRWLVKDVERIAALDPLQLGRKFDPAGPLRRRTNLPSRSNLPMAIMSRLQLWWRRPAHGIGDQLLNIGAFEGRGVWFWVSPIEARMCRQEEIVLVGGGNSAGQAAVFLSGFASKIWMLVRGPAFAETTSRYLIDRIGVTPNIEVFNADGNCRLGRVDVADWPILLI
jgi:hypothetical protein